MKNAWKKCLAVVLSVFMIATSLVMVPDTGAVVEAMKNPTGVKRNVMVGYYHVFKNGAAPGLKLRDVDECWDVIELSFGEPSDGAGNVIFNPMVDGVYASEQELIDDVAYVQARGQKVCLSIGGQNGKVSLTSSSQADDFYRTVTGIIDKYNLDGFDIDFEGHSIYLDGDDYNLKNPTSPTVVNLITATKRICANYGDDFILTMAPETLLCHNGYAFYGGSGDSRNGVYLPVIDALRDDLSWLQAQLYNTANGYVPEYGLISSGSVFYNVVMMDMLMTGFYVGEMYKPENVGNPDLYFEGLEPSQMVMGVPSGTGAAGSCVLSPDQYIQVMDLMMNGGTVDGYTVKNASKEFRGIMTWSINWDVFNGRNFSTPIAPWLDEANGAFGLVLTPSNSSTEVYTGTNITYTATASGNDLGTVNYKFELYKGSNVIETQESTSNSFTYTYNTPGTYKVRVTATNSVGVETCETEGLTVSARPIGVNSVTVNPNPAQVGDTLTWSCDAYGSGNVQYKFDIYKNGTMIRKGNFTSTASCTYTPTVASEYKVVVTVVDSIGQTAVGRGGLIWVNPYQEKLSITNIASSSASAGSPVTFTVTANGGEGIKEYSYYIVKNGTLYTPSEAFVTDNVVTFTPPTSGTYTLRVYVEDDTDRVVSTKTFTV